MKRSGRVRRAAGAVGALWMAAVVAASGCSGQGASDDYVPPIPGTWRQLGAVQRSITINVAGGRDPNFAPSGPVDIFTNPLEIHGNTALQGDLKGRHIEVDLGGGETMTLDFVSDTQIVRQPGGETYWKTFVPDLVGGYWCVQGQPGRDLTFDVYPFYPNPPVDPAFTFSFLLTEPKPDGLTSDSSQGFVSFTRQGDENDFEGNPILLGTITELILPSQPTGDKWTGTFDGASSLRLIRGTEKLTLVRRLLPIACD
jgi:hypothetical protein